MTIPRVLGFILVYRREALRAVVATHILRQCAGVLYCIALTAPMLPVPHFLAFGPLCTRRLPCWCCPSLSTVEGFL